MLYSLFFRNHALFYSILNGVLVFKLRAAHWCTHATISIQGQLYRYSYRQISVTIHRRIDISNTALGTSAVYHQQRYDTYHDTEATIASRYGTALNFTSEEFRKNSCLLNTAYYRAIANYRQSRQLTSALWRASIIVPQYNIGNGICLMFTLGTPHQVKYSDYLHLVFNVLINNNVLVLINFCCNVLILIY